MTTPTTLSPAPWQKFFDNNGLPLAKGKLFTYVAATNTKLATYTDSTGGTPNPNPVILDFRGEANVWIPPNVAYKWVLSPPDDTDPPTNPIKTVDQLVSSQLITLYGGVDTGIANVYVLTFAASFSAYTDGVVVIWIPSHTNTGGSTININGLGVISIVNADGSSLSAGELTANAPAQILIKGGQAILQNPFAQFSSGAFPMTFGGGTSAPTAQCFFTRVGNTVTLTLPNMSATSNSTDFFFSGLPANLQISTALNIIQVAMTGVLDNTAPVTGDVSAWLNSGSGTILFAKNGNSNSWTASGLKGLFFPTVITYSVQ